MVQSQQPGQSAVEGDVYKDDELSSKCTCYFLYVQQGISTEGEKENSFSRCMYWFWL